MIIELDQNATHIRVTIRHDDRNAWSDVASVYKRWAYQKDASPLFPDFTIYPAASHLGSTLNPGVKELLVQAIYNSITAHLCYQLDQLFKTQEDFKRPVKVVQYGPVFYVEWAEEAE